MKIKKRNEKTQQYEKYTPPRDRNVKLMCRDIQEVVNCAECGKEEKYGNTYISKKIQDETGFGFPICKSCNTSR